MSYRVLCNDMKEWPRKKYRYSYHLHLSVFPINIFQQQLPTVNSRFTLLLKQLRKKTTMLNKAMKNLVTI